MSEKFNMDGKSVRQLAKILVETNLTEIEYEDEGRRIRVVRQLAPMATPTYAAQPMPMTVTPTESTSVAVSSPVAASPSPANHPGAVKSPMVGTAYMAPEPGAAPYVKVGDTVSVGQTLMIIEAMKVMNPIKAPTAGKVTQILVEDGRPVEYGEPLMIIE